MSISTVVKMGYGTSIPSVVCIGYIIAEAAALGAPLDGSSMPVRNTKSHLNLIETGSHLNNINIKSQLKEL